MPKFPTELSQKERTVVIQTGIALGLIGTGCLIERSIRTGWLPLLLICSAFIFIYLRSIQENQVETLIVGAILIGCCAGLYWQMDSRLPYSTFVRIGSSLISIGGGFVLILIGKLVAARKYSWWAFFVGWTLMSLGIPFLATRLQLLFFVLCMVSGVGSGLLIWGVGKRLLGLIIPGSVLTTIGIGIYSAWTNAVSTNGLTETGIMLVWFALGWGAIIVFARVMTTRFIWWPLIPGGILAVVGWGLYSGGNPNNALSFIGNTGSIGVLIFGLYLLLIRRGMKG